MLSHQAIATEGLWPGSSMVLTATLGMRGWGIDVIVEPIIPVAGSGGGYADRPPEEKVKLTFIINIAGQRVIKNYIVTEHAGMQLLKHIKLTKKMTEKVMVHIDKLTNLLHRAKAAMAKVNISMTRKNKP